jgi:hypothetical protein
MKDLVVDPTSPSGLRWSMAKPTRRTDLVAGSLNPNGYWQVDFGSKTRYCHQLVIEIADGISIPADMVVDHVDNNRSNNARANLRLIPKRQNNRKRTATALSGYRGVSAMRNKWRARIKVNNKTLTKGGFSTAYAAHIEACALRLEHFWSP